MGNSVIFIYKKKKKITKLNSKLLVFPLIVLYGERYVEFFSEP